MNRLLTFMASVGATFALLAAPITPEQALQRVKGADAPSGMRVPAASSLALKNTVMTDNQQPALYLFGDSDRMLVVAADDEVTPLLGYIDGQTSGEMPPQMKWWLQEYASQIEFMRDNIAKSSPTGLKLMMPAKAAPLKALRTAIDPMVTTTWNQDEPYNDLCPEVNGQRAVTGCVATAAAQVMKYFEWPQEAEGVITYDDDGVTRSLDLSDITFEWGNMLDSYDPYHVNYDQFQANAVAQLMQAVGYAAHMSYGVDGSGAQDMQMFIGAQDYFQYNEKAQCMRRDVFGSDEWEQMIYDNLSTVGPLYYSGSDGQGSGHAFVCDGYDGGGYFHFNWGWGGHYDGYFKLDALNPDGQGIGGNSGSYNYGQVAFINFTTPDGATIPIPTQSPFTFVGNMTAVISGQHITFGSDAGQHYACLYNSSGRDGDFAMAMKVTSEDGTVTKYGNSRDFSCRANYGFVEFDLAIPSELTDGNYTATVAVRYQDSSEWLDVLHYPEDKCYVDIVVKDGRVRLAGQLDPFSYSGLTADASASVSKPLHYSFNASNPNPETATETLTPLLGTLNNNRVTPIAWGSEFQVELNANETKTIENDMPITFLSGYEEFTGEAVLCLVVDGQIEDYCYVTITEPEVPVSSISVEPQLWSGETGDSIQLSVVIMPENATNKNVEWSSSNEDVATVDANGLVSAKTAGVCVITVSTTDGSNLSAKCEITTVADVLSIMAEDETVDIYNLNGMLIKKDCTRDNLKSILPGAYVLRQGDRTRKVIIR